MKKISYIFLITIFLSVLTVSIIVGVKLYVPRAEAQACVRYTVVTCNSSGCGCPAGYNPVSTTQCGSGRPYVPARYMTLCLGS
ncbi:MAG: hypothetical protein K8S27_12455 [Candidatus Omnitrophica bacterium]|nr:hypothetical protein [Candidatus Omnitrophota bacterium]